MDNDQKIKELSRMQQNIANLSSQKQQFVAEKNEYKAALNQLDKTEKSYKIIGNIMISAKKEDLKKELQNKIEMIEVRIKTFEKQEDALNKKAQDLQNEVMNEIKNKK